jgi:hypothetical protein
MLAPNPLRFDLKILADDFATFASIAEGEASEMAAATCLTWRPSP